jgi:GH35 family endo-1,4-beta-xylanase
MERSRRDFLMGCMGVVPAAQMLAKMASFPNPAVGGATEGTVELDEAGIDALIERNRKGNFSLTLAAEDAKKAAGVKIDYKLTRLDFDVGTVLYRSTYDLPQSNPDRAQYLDKIDKYFTSVLIPLFWDALEPEPGKYNFGPYLEMCRWAVEHGKRPIGHSLFYGWRGYDDADPADEDKLFVQPWVRALTKQQLEEAMKSHLRTVLKTFEGKINDYVLNNEVLGKYGEQPDDYYSEVLGFKSLEPYFRWANETAPQVRFYVNENSILGGKNAPRYVEMVQALQQTGVRVGAIGDQGHMFIDRAPSNKDAWAVLQQLAVLKLPIQVTEFGIQTTNENQYAEDLRRIYRVCFAHPSVMGVTRWGMWEPEMWPREKAVQDSQQLDGAHARNVREAHLWRKDWSPTPAAIAHMNLMTKEWISQGSGQTDQHGELKFRGFYGRYRIGVAGKSYPVELTPHKRSASLNL